MSPTDQQLRVFDAIQAPPIRQRYPLRSGNWASTSGAPWGQYKPTSKPLSVRVPSKGPPLGTTTAPDGS
jgi:hypothetical protein